MLKIHKYEPMLITSSQSLCTLYHIHRKGLIEGVFFLRFYLFIFRQRGKEGEREGEKHQCVVASCVPPTGDLAHNPGMCPDWELNWRLFGLLAGTQSTEPHQSGLIEFYNCSLMIDTFNQSSKYLMSVVIARGHKLEKKRPFLWNERSCRMGGGEEFYLLPFLGKENSSC